MMPSWAYVCVVMPASGRLVLSLHHSGFYVDIATMPLNKQELIGVVAALKIQLTHGDHTVTELECAIRKYLKNKDVPRPKKPPTNATLDNTWVPKGQTKRFRC